MVRFLWFNRVSDKEVAMWDSKDNINLGKLEYLRVGQWRTWTLFLNEDCYLSAGCLDKVREVIKRLNADRYYCLIGAEENKKPKEESSLNEYLN